MLILKTINSGGKNNDKGIDYVILIQKEDPVHTEIIERRRMIRLHRNRPGTFAKIPNR
jgi:hypothetical protein